MATLQIIGLVLLIGGVLGCGALFLWVITADKRKARKEVFCLISEKTSSPGNITSTLLQWMMANKKTPAHLLRDVSWCATLLGACQVR